MIKILLFLFFFYYSWKLLGRLLFGDQNREVEREAYIPEPPYGRSSEKDVTNRARVVKED